MINQINLTPYPIGNMQTVYTAEGNTALELAGITAKKVNECVDVVNGVDALADQARQVVLEMQAEQATIVDTLKQQVIPTVTQEYVNEKISDGTIGTLINQTLLADINSDITQNTSDLVLHNTRITDAEQDINAINAGISDLDQKIDNGVNALDLRLDTAEQGLLNQAQDITQIEQDVSALGTTVTGVEDNVIDILGKLPSFPNVFNTTDDMLSSPLVVAGSTYLTLGRNNLLDGGGAFFKCYAKGSYVDNTGSIRTNTNHAFVAIKNGAVNAKLYGVFTTSSDVKSALQKCVDNEKNIKIDPGIYNCILPITNDTHIIRFENDCVVDAYGANLKVSTGSLNPNYQIIDIKSSETVTINGLTVTGERYIHTGSTGEWGFCFRVRNGAKARFNDCVGADAWGDAFFLGESITYGPGYADVIMNNCVSIRSRRNGCSPVSWKGENNNFKAIDTGGTAPERGICIEPDDGDNYMDCSINNYVSIRNKGTLSVTTLRLTRPSSVIVNGIESHDDGGADLNSRHLISLEIQGSPSTVNVSNANINNPKNAGITNVVAGAGNRYMLDNIKAIGARNSNSQVLHQFQSTSAGSVGYINFTDIDCEGASLYAVYSSAGEMTIKADIKTQNSPTNKYIDGTSAFYRNSASYDLQTN